MAAGDSWTSWLLLGLAEHLAANSLGAWRPTPGDVYLESEVAIVIRDIPPVPDRLITLATYPVSTGPTNLSDFTIGVQARIRGTVDPQVCDDIGSELFDLLDSSGRQIWGTGAKQVAIVDVWQQTAGSLGKDSLGRWEASSNFYVQAMRPTIHRSK